MSPTWAHAITAGTASMTWQKMQASSVPKVDSAEISMKEINPVYAEGTVPAAAYGTPADVATIVVPNVLLVRDDFPSGNACAITKLIFDKKAELEKVHVAAKELDPKIALDTAPVELAPGAKTALEQAPAS